MRHRCYIAGPISKGDLCHNVNQATDAFIRLAKAGLAPMCPHWSVYCKEAKRGVTVMGAGGLTRIGTDRVFCEATVDGCPGMTHADWLSIDLAWVQMSDCLLRLPGESKGADAEVEHARLCEIPVFDTVEKVIAWASR